MPAFLENKLKRRYGRNSKIPYKIMNSIGAMRGNKETAKGAAMERKHNRDMRAGRKSARLSKRSGRVTSRKHRRSTRS